MYGHSLKASAAGIRNWYQLPAWKASCSFRRGIASRKLKRPPRGSTEKATDLGYVGEPTKINPHVLEVLMSTDVIPVVAPIGIGPEGETYNINADTSAGAIAGAMKALSWKVLEKSFLNTIKVTSMVMLIIIFSGSFSHVFALLGVPKAILAAKSVDEAIQLQSEFSKSAFETYVDELAKFGDMALAAAKGAAEPLQARVSAFVHLVKAA